MTERVTISSVEEAQSLERLAVAVGDAQRASESKQTSMTTHVPKRVEVTYQEGKTSVKSDRPEQVQIAGPAVPKGHVKVSNGSSSTVMSIEAAENAGLMDMAVEFNRADQRDFKKGPLQTAPQAEAPKNDPAGQNDQPDPLTVPEETRVKMVVADSALTQASAAIGANAVQTMQADVVSSGELPTELPEGVTAEMVTAIADGYVAQANAVLSDTGASVDAMMALLNESELRDARLAVFRGDDARLKALGSRAIGRLHSLPADPVLFKELTAGWPKEVQIVQRGGQTLLHTPNWQMTWSEAVDAGHIRF